MLFWLSETGKIWGFQAFWSCSVNFPHYGDPLAWNWSYFGFLGIIWRTCGSKCRGEGGGIFPTLCVECCLGSYLILIQPFVIQGRSFKAICETSTNGKHVSNLFFITALKFVYVYVECIDCLPMFCSYNSDKPFTVLLSPNTLFSGLSSLIIEFPHLIYIKHGRWSPLKIIPMLSDFLLLIIVYKYTSYACCKKFVIRDGKVNQGKNL